jgi:hypothetical protein
MKEINNNDAHLPLPSVAELQTPPPSAWSASEQLFHRVVKDSAFVLKNISLFGRQCRTRLSPNS